MKKVLLITVLGCFVLGMFCFGGTCKYCGGSAENYCANCGQSQKPEEHAAQPEAVEEPKVSNSDPTLETTTAKTTNDPVHSQRWIDHYASQVRIAEQKCKEKGICIHKILISEDGIFPTYCREAVVPGTERCQKHNQTEFIINFLDLKNTTEEDSDTHNEKIRKLLENDNRCTCVFGIDDNGIEHHCGEYFDKTTEYFVQATSSKDDKYCKSCRVYEH